MVTEKAQAEQFNVVEVEGPAKDTEYEFVGLGTWPEQETPLNRPGAGFNYGSTFRAVAERSQNILLFNVGHLG